MSEICLRVSIGEALDKLSILEIKLEKIQDSRRNDVLTEYEYLYSELKEYTTQFGYQYKFLKDINLQIWNLQDEIRDDYNNFISKCEDVLFLNDARFTLKNKINTLAKSQFKEQKGYKIRTVCIMIKELNDSLIENILYISAFYDETLLIANDTQTEQLLSKDKTIRILNSETPIEQDWDVVSYVKNNQFTKITHKFLQKNKSLIMTEEIPLVSVIIPTYNRFNYLLNAINSVKDQTYNNIEIIVVNDCSTESEYYKNDFPGCKVIHLKPNSR